MYIIYVNNYTHEEYYSNLIREKLNLFSPYLDIAISKM